MKTMILAAALAMTPLAACADSHSDERESYCQDLAGMAYSVAGFRDRGYTLENAYWILTENYDETVTEQEFGDAVAVVDYLYAFPRHPAKDEANAVYTICIEGE